MIRNGMAAKLAAQSRREQLTARWSVFPEAVRQKLAALDQGYGLAAAALATEALEAYHRPTQTVAEVPGAGQPALQTCGPDVGAALDPAPIPLEEREQKK